MSGPLLITCEQQQRDSTSMKGEVWFWHPFITLGQKLTKIRSTPFRDDGLKRCPLERSFRHDKCGGAVLNKKQWLSLHPACRQRQPTEDFGASLSASMDQ